ncbi:MAG TPA: hypothetical protein PK668_13050 [Myxococcota bacterium]|nr:hypothetical protein [Myxococcota bacterium]HRY93603.1 hypothetical protein [Myxococcota bacterium]
MSRASEWDRVIGTLRSKPGFARVREPGVGKWSTSSEGEDLRLELEMDVAKLAGSIQGNAAASPTFLWVFAWWLKRLEGAEVRSRLTLTGQVPGRNLLHVRRNAFVLNEYCMLLGDRFEIRGTQLPWEWPNEPKFNVESGERDCDLLKVEPGSEAWFERLLCGGAGEQIREALNARLSPGERFTDMRRQLPVGMFDRKVNDANRWTLGGKAAVDAWALSDDKNVLHLFELKVKRNVKVGIIPEALYYASVVSFIRDAESPMGTEKSQVFSDMRELHPRIVMWLVAPSFHPLVHRKRASGWVSPLEDLNEALVKRRIEFRILPYDHDGGKFLGWR